MQYLKTALAKFGVDGAIALTVLSRLITAGGGLLSIVFIAKYLNNVEQGYYYTFASIIALQVFFELGLSSVITQYTAHEFAHLSILDTEEVIGDEFHSSRAASLLRFCIKCFGIISISLFLILIAIGFYFFSKYNDSIIQWKQPWVLLCLATSLNLFIDPILAYLEGVGRVKDIAKIRVIQKSAFIILLFAFFLLGFGLYSSALASLIAILVNYCQIIFSNRLRLLKNIWYLQRGWTVNYLKEIFPFQWKIALSWISGYFIFQLFNPVLFATAGPKVAGQMGMTLTALNGISALSMSWIGTKVPILSGYIARNEIAKLHTTFYSTLKNIVVVNIFFLGFFLVFLWFLRYMNFEVGNRFLPFNAILLLSLVTLANQFIFSWATYLRCHKQEPYLVMSVVTGIACCLSTLILGNYFGLYGLVIGYFMITLVITLPWAYLVFKNRKLAWHS